MTDEQFVRENMNERADLRAEMAMFNWMIFICTWAIMLFLAYLHPQVSGSEAARNTSIALGVAWIYSMARFDYLIHRAGAFLRPTSLWENSPTRNQKKWILAAADAGSMLVILYFWLYAMYQLAQSAEGSATLSSLLGTAAVLFAGGIFLLIQAARVR